MRSFSVISLLSALTLLLNHSQVAVASPVALEETDVEKRCAKPCGSGGWLCCREDETCSTNSANQAVCSGGSGGQGDWQYFTTTYVVTETDKSTITSVWSSRHAQTAAPTQTGSCKLEIGESTCGNDCCDASSTCENGKCVQESSSADASATPPVRGTSSGMSTATETAAPTTTRGFIAPVGTDGADLVGAKASDGGGGLSGGAIAGIVVGTIAGVFLLLLLCLCMCFKGSLDRILAALGFGKRRRKDTTYVEERYSHHSHGSRPAPGRRTWFGTRPAAPPTESDVSEKKSKWSGLATVGIILGALALCLGLKRRHDREQDHDDDKTSYTYPSSYYYSDYYTQTKVQTDERETHDSLDDHAHDPDADD
ncbi:hypothetical protein NUU61_007919 [Penicillium alfredii]|uniref:Mid2 domain-containing protein n=1 Tax=Penicillium alfredii TaxID=1506179 RepID=A0A9W9JZG7_9EURO|nr:uncharacterized protein NUU61_007919 [Penicillium alfredii]KAJ5086612.1 hypothetical protein NUU61_007919 [Penicillium alfredii]